MFNRILLSFMLCHNLYALQIHSLVDQKHTTLSVSQDQMNRITVQGDRIQHIFGSHDLEVQTDEERGQIFLRLLRPEKSLTVTIVTESGLTQDLQLIPKEIDFQSILLKPSPTTPAKAPLSSLQRRIQLLKGMLDGDSVSGFTLSKAPFDRRYPEPLKILSHLRYHGEFESGHLYHIKNDGEVPLKLTEEMLALPGDDLLSLSQHTLQRNQESWLFVVRSNGERP